MPFFEESTMCQQAYHTSYFHLVFELKVWAEVEMAQGLSVAYASLLEKLGPQA